MENVFSISICVEPILLNRKSTSYNIYIYYFNEHDQEKYQYIGTQMYSKECKFYPIPLYIMYGHATFTVKWIENVDFDLDKKDKFKEVK